MFEKILIANRGEIAIRLAQAAQEMHIKTVAIYSDPDKNAPHVLAADESYALGGETSLESYLNIDKIITAAKTAGAQAIHPGYGFLSERYEFAKRCWDENIVFIGPNPDAIKKMGNKIEAKRLMHSHGVPIVPGYDGSLDNLDAFLDKAEEIGYPIIIKAASGGGGKGMRVIKNPEDLIPSIESASREAKSAFGSPRVFIEKYITSPRHIEIQVLGDNFGNVIHLFERECSIQRRYQKIIEETPSPALTPELRQIMGEAAVKAAKAVNYNSAGTVEFIFDDKTKKYYFLEMNTRLQVEHPITEAVVGIDIPQWMIKIADGKPLTLKQEDLHQRGHAIECRICAENPENLEFRPSIGKIAKFELKPKVGIRHDTGVEQGSIVSINYDRMIAKLIVHAQSRSEAIQKMNWALSNYTVLGIDTNIEFLRDIITHPQFGEGNIDTHFINNYLQGWRSRVKMLQGVPLEVLIATALYDMFNPDGKQQSMITSLKQTATNAILSPWKTIERWGRKNLETSSLIVGLTSSLETTDLNEPSKKNLKKDK